MKRLFFSLIAVTVTVKLLVLATGCANPIAPLGGLKDSLPPVLVSSSPKDSVRNFNGNKITFYFDEFVDLDNVQENLIVSPTPKVNPVVEHKLKTITVKIKDTLEPNTTYTYNFGKAIKDINEGNVLKNFSFVFSTGKTIDSLSLNGKVILAQTGQVDSTLIIMLHSKTDDSAVIKDRPRYITRVDGRGNFAFHNLPAGSFMVYALKDESGQHKYLSAKQLFAFADKPVIIGGENPPVTLYAYAEKVAEEKPNVPSVASPSKRLPDKNKEAQDKRLRFANNLENGAQNLLGNLEFTFNDPLKNFDSAKIQFTDEAYKPVANYSIVKDTNNKKVSLIYQWKENTPYNLIVDKDFAEDSTGRKIPRTDTLHFRAMKASDYGSLRLRFSNLDLSKKPVLQLVENDVIKFSAPLRSKDFSQKLFKPGQYNIRILYDDNENGVWDSGEFFGKHRQPEKVQSVSRSINVKANWDNDVSIEL